MACQTHEPMNGQSPPPGQQALGELGWRSLLRSLVLLPIVAIPAAPLFAWLGDVSLGGGYVRALAMSALGGVILLVQARIAREERGESG